jgi:hypothetical protein
MTVADNSIIRAAAHFSGPNASDCVNIYHFVSDSVGDISEADLLEDVLGYVEGLMAIVEGVYSTSTVLDRVEAWKRDTVLNRWDNVGEVSGTWTGSQGSAEVTSAQVAPQVNADTNNAHVHARKYLPPPLETGITGGLLSSAFLGLLATFLGAWTSTYIGVHTELATGVWSEILSNFVQFSGTGTLRARAGTQRRRKSNVGS